MTTTETTVKMILDRWNASIKNFGDLLNSLTDEQLQKEIAPKRNRGVYLIGHLIAVHDLMIPLLDMGEKLYPNLQQSFFELPDKAVAEIPSAKELRECWIKHCEWLRQKFESLKPEQWFDKHTVVSDEDFAKEPHRNKLNIIVTRTSHLQYHTGQFVLLK
ncbi:DinB family protein [Parapedobacter tibetensis]|uniref:DinB family protein n=1 Tax=Parapedobacter tibetensis TaxID=2972951 RepID=UPI00214D6FBE|nr:DinB family protein [Parapedobacter tibetensis]